LLSYCEFLRAALVKGGGGLGPSGLVRFISRKPTPWSIEWTRLKGLKPELEIHRSMESGIMAQLTCFKPLMFITRVQPPRLVRPS
jgi:hypothetical protein